MPSTPSEQLCRVLEQHQPQDDVETAHLSQLRTYARTLEHPWSRHQTPAHFTASALVVSPDGERVCLVHHAKLGRWLQPGGHLDGPEETLEQGALREAREETGLELAQGPWGSSPVDVDVHVIPARKEDPEHKHLDVRFMFVAKDEAALAHDPRESMGARWFDWDEALAKSDDGSLRRLLQKGRKVLTAARAQR